MLIEAHGYSRSSKYGVPFLVVHPSDEASDQGVLIVDYLVKTVEIMNEVYQFDYEIKQVYNMNQLSGEIRAVKVRAGRNRDLIPVDPL